MASATSTRRGSAAGRRGVGSAAAGKSTTTTKTTAASLNCMAPPSKNTTPASATNTQIRALSALSMVENDCDDDNNVDVDHDIHHEHDSGDIDISGLDITERTESNEADDDEGEGGGGEEYSEAARENLLSPPPHPSFFVESFQSRLLSRRTTSRFLSLQQEEDQQEQQQQQQQVDYAAAALKLALDRAVQCGQNAPNHKRTEPFWYQRMMQPNSNSIEALSNIVHDFTLLKQKPKSVAQKKRDKWGSIPAYLVALVENQPNQEVLDDNDDDVMVTNPLLREYKFVAPQTEQQLEDYAAACASVQNVLLSLHAEGIGTKWATGAVLKTPAFRQLCNLLPTDRVVGLIMVGKPAARSRAPRRRRQDILVEME